MRGVGGKGLGCIGEGMGRGSGRVSNGHYVQGKATSVHSGWSRPETTPVRKQVRV